MGGNVDGINGDVVILAPPYNVTDAELTEIVEKTAASIAAGAEGRGAGVDHAALDHSPTLIVARA